MEEEKIEENEIINDKKEKTRKIIGIISLVFLILSLLGQIAYLILHTRYQLEYTIDYLLNIVNEVIIVSWFLTAFFLFEKSKIKNLIISFILIILTIVNILFFCKNGLKQKSIIDYSDNYSNVLVLKENKTTGEVVVYKNTKFIFTRAKEKFSYSVKDDLKIQWITNDTCSITYKDINDNLREYVATYGDRGNGVSYYNVLPAISGTWQNRVQNEEQVTLSQKDGIVEITKGDNKEAFLYTECKQYGTIALVLSKEDKPKYIIALNENCNLDDQTDILKDNGTIMLKELSMDNTVTQELFRTSIDN